MTEQKLREKIVEVISQKQTYGITEEFKTEDLGHGGWQAWTETTKVNNAEIADALIAAGLKFDTIVSHTATFDLVQQEQINRLEREVAEAEHRAEVAERALKLAEKLGELCAPAKDYIKQAEKELAGGGGEE